MQGQQIYSKLKNFFPKEIENLNISQLGSNLFEDFENLSFLISSSIPHLSIDQIHTLCRRQQKNVMDKIMELKHIDLYQEIANVCPSQKGLRNMPTEEVTMKINEMTTKMALEQKMMDEQDDEMESYSEESHSKGQEESSEMVQPMQIEDIDYDSMHEAKGLHNIFEEEYNTHLPWNEMCIYDLN